MIRHRDFAPQQLTPAGFLTPATYETFEAAVVAANNWLQENSVRVITVETVVLPNVWSRYEDGTNDASLGTSGESPSHWHQILRVWYQE